MKNLIAIMPVLLVTAVVHLPQAQTYKYPEARAILCIDDRISFSAEILEENIPFPGEGEERLQTIEDRKKAIEYRQFLDHCRILRILKEELIGAKIFPIYNPRNMEKKAITYAQFKNRELSEPTHIFVFSVGVIYQAMLPAGGKFVVEGGLRLEIVDKDTWTGLIYEQVNHEIDSDQLHQKVGSQKDVRRRNQCLDAFGKQLALLMIARLNGRQKTSPAQSRVASSKERASLKLLRASVKEIQSLYQKISGEEKPIPVEPEKIWEALADLYAVIGCDMEPEKMSDDQAQAIDEIRAHIEQLKEIVGE